MLTNSAFTVNENITTKDTRAINSFIEPHLFMNNLLKAKKDLERNATIIDIDSRYNYRPDRLAYEVYGQDFWYPAILIVNNLGSILQFKADILNFKCKIPAVDDVRNILGLPQNEHITLETIVDNVFKS